MKIRGWAKKHGFGLSVRKVLTATNKVRYSATLHSLTPGINLVYHEERAFKSTHPAPTVLSRGNKKAALRLLAKRIRNKYLFTEMQGFLREMVLLPSTLTA